VTRVLWLWHLSPQGKSSGAATCPATPNGLWTIGIKKDLAALSTHLVSHVPKALPRVTEVPVRRADMLRHHNLQDVWKGRYSGAQ
jgi:hypothetical protein